MGHRNITTTRSTAAHLLLLLLLLACSGLFTTAEAARPGNRHARFRREDGGTGGHGHRREGVVYQVGDEAGWSDHGVNYKHWSSSKKFHVGDSIVFRYEKNRHKVFEVSRDDFKNCNPLDPIGIRKRGYDSFTMTEKSHRFFIGDRESCLVGQKVDIRVLDLQGSDPSSSSVSSKGHREAHRPAPISSSSTPKFASPIDGTPRSSRIEDAPSPSPISSRIYETPRSSRIDETDQMPHHHHRHHTGYTVGISIVLVILFLGFCFAIWKAFRGWFTCF